MTIAIMILVLVNTAAIVYLATIIFEIREKTNNVYHELMKIMAEQRDVLQGTLDSTNRWCDIGEDIIEHIERVEDMEGDIKDIFEWIHSVDDNIADMRKDIQKILYKFDENVYHYIHASTKQDTNVNTILDAISCLDLNKKIVSKLPPDNVYPDDQKGDEVDEQG